MDDSAYAFGQVGIGMVGYRTDEFDHLGVTPVKQAAPAPATLAADLPPTIHRGESATLRTTFTVPASADAATGLTLRPGAPDGWTVTAPTAAATPVSVTFSPLATYIRGGVQHWTYGTARTEVPIPAAHREPLPEPPVVRLQQQRPAATAAGRGRRSCCWSGFGSVEMG
ncbi:hypothetical protein ABZ379_20720 [Streptomyces canus]|uniref:hypothetical protein n=1 Tax=Streptomyces canus TaxID=58343 RepID=UPI003400ACF1